jgi:hypothetical protein
MATSTIGLRYETTADQLRSVISRLHDMLGSARDAAAM